MHGRLAASKGIKGQYPCLAHPTKKAVPGAQSEQTRPPILQHILPLLSLIHKILTQAQNGQPLLTNLSGPSKSSSAHVPVLTAAFVTNISRDSFLRETVVQSDTGFERLKILKIKLKGN